LPLSKHFTNYSETKKIWIILQLIYSPLADVKADICDLPFEDNQYDVILCNHVLEHIPDDTKAMQELYRVLKPGGILQTSRAIKSCNFSDDTITDQKNALKYLDNMIMFAYMVVIILTS
jgi:ubiquinone/menaquinone biosynthesis C-methylase UbiE